MDHNNIVQLELPPDLLKALHTLKEGGLLSAVTQTVPPQTCQLVPCLIARVPLISKLMDNTVPWAVTLHSQYYEPEGPLVLITLTLYDRLPRREIVKLHGSLIGQRIHLGQLFELQCFLNPTLKNTRFFLQAVASSPLITISLYQTNETMTHQTTRLAQPLSRCSRTHNRSYKRRRACPVHENDFWPLSNALYANILFTSKKGAITLCLR